MTLVRHEESANTYEATHASKPNITTVSPYTDLGLESTSIKSDTTSEAADVESIKHLIESNRARALAKSAFYQVVNSLKHSPNNLNYRKSPSYKEPKKWLNKNKQALLNQLEEDFSSLSYTPVDHDVGLIRQFHRTHKGRKSVFTALDLAYGGESGSGHGIRDHIDNFYTNHNKGIEVKINGKKLSPNDLAITAISSLLVRAHYMTKVSDRLSELGNLDSARERAKKEGLDTNAETFATKPPRDYEKDAVIHSPIQNLFAQNTLSIIRRAAHRMAPTPPHADERPASSHQ